jgi:membrane fusion protein (multidrug efflux system)
MLLIGAWVVWLFLARITIYRATDQASIELVNDPIRLDAPVSGRIVTSRLVLGDQVYAGEVLVELDAQGEQRQLDEDKAQLTSLAPQLSAIRAEIMAAQEGLSAEEQSGRVALDQAGVKWEGAKKEWKTADEIARRYIKSREVVSEIELLQRTGEAQSRLTTANSLQLEVGRLATELQTQKNDRTAHIAQLTQEQTHLEGEEETTKADIKRLEYEADRHSIRAPARGRVVGIAGLGIGTFVPAGGRLGTIAPPRQLKAVAEFPSTEALGHILPGQPAWLRLNGFPWTQYGTISATVASIASESQDDRVRVDLWISPKATRIPIQEGLSGWAEVEVEHISPASLIMRAAGTLMTNPARSTKSVQPGNSQLR